jgi:hypothetical protein
MPFVAIAMAPQRRAARIKAIVTTVQAPHGRRKSDRPCAKT